MGKLLCEGNPAWFLDSVYKGSGSGPIINLIEFFYQNLKDDFYDHLNECYISLYIVLVIWPLHQNHNGDNLDLQEENNQNAMENEAELVKSLSKQRQRAIQAAHRGRKTLASRNSYKDKGGRSSHNSKIQKQLSNW